MEAEPWLRLRLFLKKIFTCDSIGDYSCRFLFCSWLYPLFRHARELIQARPVSKPEFS
jgi:hypothetical protein